MKWNELKRQALKHGFVLDKHGASTIFMLTKKQV